MLGVIGVGNVGSRVAALAQVLGMKVLMSDPPRAELEPGFVSLAVTEILGAADVVTCHVPLTRTGAHATQHLLDTDGIARLRPGAVVLNTSRGGVIDDAALGSACAAGRMHAVLDVWQTEPEPEPALLDVVRFATPHIAGYSLDGKLAGTRIIAAALQVFLGAAEGPAPAIFTAPVAAPRVAIGVGGRDGLRAAVRHAYAIRADDERMRAALAHPTGTRAQAFDRLRRDYPVRREFAGFVVTDAADLDMADRRLLTGLGFALAG